MIYRENTPEELAGALEKLLSDPDEMDRLSRNGREGVDRHFHINVQAERMVEVYLDAIRARTTGKIKEAV